MKWYENTAGNSYYPAYMQTTRIKAFIKLLNEGGTPKWLREIKLQTPTSNRAEEALLEYSEIMKRVQAAKNPRDS